MHQSAVVNDPVQIEPSTSQRAPRNRRRRSRGQSLVEFAIVLPVLLAIVGGIIQFGIIFWAQNTLTQVARDTGRWAATQTTCSAAGLANQADLIAQNSSLIGYVPGSWTTVVSYPSSPRPAEGIEAAWTGATPCPPANNATASWVSLRLDHNVPVFFPGFQYLPGIGTCDATGCRVSLTSTTQFRMEPTP